RSALRTAKSEATFFPSALPQSAIIFWFHTSPKSAAIFAELWLRGLRRFPGRETYFACCAVQGSAADVIGMLALMNELRPRLSRPKSCSSELSILDSPRSRYPLIPMVDSNLSLKTNPACSYFLLQAFGADPTLRLQRKFTRLSRQLNVSKTKKGHQFSQRIRRSLHVFCS